MVGTDAASAGATGLGRHLSEASRGDDSGRPGSGEGRPGHAGRETACPVFFLIKVFDYPISLKWETFRNMGLATIVAAFSYLKATIFKRKENSLEDFYINRFGRKLYSMFFENYTENLWGRHPSEIDPAGAPREPEAACPYGHHYGHVRQALPNKKTAMWRHPHRVLLAPGAGPRRAVGCDGS